MLPLNTVNENLEIHDTASKPTFKSYPAQIEEKAMSDIFAKPIETDFSINSIFDTPKQEQLKPSTMVSTPLPTQYDQTSLYQSQ